MLNPHQCHARMRIIRDLTAALAHQPTLDDTDTADATALIDEFNHLDALRHATHTGSTTEEDTVVLATALLEQGLVGVGATSSPTPTSPPSG